MKRELPYKVVEKFNLKECSVICGDSFVHESIFYKVGSSITYVTDYDMLSLKPMPKDLYLVCGSKRFMTVSLLSLEMEDKKWFDDIFNYVNS